VTIRQSWMLLAWAPLSKRIMRAASRSSMRNGKIGLKNCGGKFLGSCCIVTPSLASRCHVK
jgi:hypothetical protein